MHPPFIVTDARVGRAAAHLTPPRRGAATRLTLSPATLPHRPPAPAALRAGAVVDLPPLRAVPHLRIVPPPTHRLRDRIGRWLIRLGQRMILTHHPG